MTRRILHIPETQLRVVAGEVGGSFGMKGGHYPEYALALWASRKIGRPVKWIAERGEGMLTDDHDRDHVSEGELALDRDGHFLALRARNVSNIGAYLAPGGIISPTMHLGGLASTNLGKSRRWLRDGPGNMHEKIVEIPTADGRMETFITHPEQGGPFAPVIIYMDVWGLREELYDIARKVAVVGYYVLLPDLYYRQGRIRHQWRNEHGQMISMHNLDPERQAQVRAPLQKLTDTMVVADSGTILDFLAKGEPVHPGGVGAIGYCMGGRHVMCVAGAYPERFIAGASLHGTQLVSDREDSPHRLGDRFRGQLYCGFAEKDPNAAPPIRQALGEAFAGCPVDYCYEVHPGAEHGYALPDRDIYDKRAANRDWELIFAMFRRQLSA